MTGSSKRRRTKSSKNATAAADESKTKKTLQEPPQVVQAVVDFLQLTCLMGLVGFDMLSTTNAQACYDGRWSAGLLGSTRLAQRPSRLRHR